MSKKKDVTEESVELEKEMPVKLGAAKKPTLEKVVVSAKQIGKNLNIIVGNEKFTRVGDKEELQVVKDSIIAYNAKPTKANYEALMKQVKPETAKKVEEETKLKAEVKATKNKAKEEEKENKTKVKHIKVADVVKEIDDKLMTDEELATMQAALDRQKEKNQVAPKTTSAPRGGESYRR